LFRHEEPITDFALVFFRHIHRKSDERVPSEKPTSLGAQVPLFGKNQGRRHTSPTALSEDVGYPRRQATGELADRERLEAAPSKSSSQCHVSTVMKAMPNSLAIV
jgi:hypothetical protein